MQKNILLFIAFFLEIGMANAQQRHFPAMAQLEKAPYNKVAKLPEQKSPELGQSVPLAANKIQDRTTNLEETVAITRWDAQSYGCVPTRIFADLNGNPTATWIFGTDQTGAFTERGCGYSVRENDAWSQSTTRIESVRTGFPASAITASGAQVVVSHVTGVSPYQLFIARKDAGSNTWSEQYLSHPPGAGVLWPHITVGGADGNTVHVIAITTPVANGGTLYQGVDGQVCYWRSTDGGQTWSAPQIIPGLDASKFDKTDADSYTVDAYGDFVAVAVFPTWNDLMVFKSQDNGENWDPITVYDFPNALENYAAAVGDSYTFDDIGFLDPDAPDSLAVFSSDGFGSVLVDGAGQVHVWFGRMYYIDDDPATASYSYYPGINGLMYWKETYATNELVYLTGALDYDGDGALGISAITEIGPYFNSLSSFPSTGTLDDGTIFLAYSAVNELFRSDWGAEKDQFYRHLYLMKSIDNGDTWGTPYELTSPPFVDEVLLPYIEAVWPSVPRHFSGDNVWVLYQQDAQPGTDLWGDNHTTSENGITYVSLTADEVPPVISSTHGSDIPQTLQVTLTPNPVKDIAQLTVNLTAREESTIVVSVYNTLGQQCKSLQFEQVDSSQPIRVPVGDLPQGNYTILVKSENERASLIMIK